jgi:hypothetical protein
MVAVLVELPARHRDFGEVLLARPPDGEALHRSFAARVAQ